MDIIKALNWRYAVKKFSPNSISDQQLETLTEAVRLSPSAYGMQPYQLIVVESNAAKEACLPFSYGQDKVVNCSHLLVLASYQRVTAQTIASFIHQLAQSQNKSAYELKGYQQQIEAELTAMTQQQLAHWASQQCYIALGTLLTTAAAMEIDACPMTGFEPQGINAALELVQLNLTAEVLIPVGLRDANDLTASRAKFRKTTSELVLCR